MAEEFSTARDTPSQGGPGSVASSAFGVQVLGLLMHLFGWLVIAMLVVSATSDWRYSTIFLLALTPVGIGLLGPGLIYYALGRLILWPSERAAVASAGLAAVHVVAAGFLAFYMWSVFSVVPLAQLCMAGFLYASANEAVEQLRKDRTQTARGFEVIPVSQATEATPRMTATSESTDSST